MARRITIVALLAGVAIATNATRADAQGAGAPDAADHGTELQLPILSDPSAAPAACLRDVPRSAFTRVPVYLGISEREIEARLLRNDAAYLAQRVATRARTLLGAHPDTLPIGEPRVTWESDGASIQVTVHRSGAVTWRMGTPGNWTINGKPAQISDSATSAWMQRHHGSLTLLEEAMRAEVAAEPPFFVWPDVVRADSLRFALRFVHETVNRAGVVPGSMMQRPVFPVFTMAEPWMEPVTVLRAGAVVRYPDGAQQARVRGTVILQFVVDTLGRVEQSSMRDLRIAETAGLRGVRGGYYRHFVAATRHNASTTHYRPARVGGCAVRQMVQRPYHFEIEN